MLVTDKLLRQQTHDHQIEAANKIMVLCQIRFSDNPSALDISYKRELWFVLLWGKQDQIQLQGMTNKTNRF